MYSGKFQKAKSQVQIGVALFKKNHKTTALVIWVVKYGDD